MIAYVNGRYVNEDEACISVFDHGFLYGDGVFEGIKAYDGRVFALDEHVERLYESAQSIQIEMPLNRAELKEVILETIRRNDLKDAYIRPVVSRGKGALGLDPRSCAKATVVIIVDADVKHPESGNAETSDHKSIKIITSSLRRSGPDVLSPRIKSTNYLNNILAKQQATAAGAQDALFLNQQGMVCELTGDNIFVVKDGRLITPPLWVGILNGVTRQTVLRLARDAGIPAEEAPLTLHDVYTCDECFCTATRIEIVPVGWIDGRSIGQSGIGPVTGRIAQLFKELTACEGTPIYPKQG